MNPITILGLFAAFCRPVSFLPHAIKTIETKDTSGISFYMYSLFVFGTLLLFLYGIFSSNIPIYIANGFTLIFSLIILGYKLKFK